MIENGREKTPKNTLPGMLPGKKPCRIIDIMLAISAQVVYALLEFQTNPPTLLSFIRWI
jgi:hypothetical protein